MQKRPKICTCCRVSETKRYLYHRSKLAKAGPGYEVWPKHPPVQKNSSSPWFVLKTLVPMTEPFSVICTYITSKIQSFFFIKGLLLHIRTSPSPKDSIFGVHMTQKVCDLRSLLSKDNSNVKLLNSHYFWKWTNANPVKNFSKGRHCFQVVN